MALAATLNQLAAKAHETAAAEAEETYQALEQWLKKRVEGGPIRPFTLSAQKNLYARVQKHWYVLQARLAAGGVRMTHNDEERNDSFIAFEWNRN